MDREAFDEIAAEFHEALPAIIAGEPDRTDLMIPLCRVIDWESDKLPDASAVKAAVIEVYGLTGMAELYSKTREPVAVEARLICTYTMTTHCGLSNSMVGRAMRRDASTTHYAKEKIPRAIATDPEVARHYQRVLKLLGIFET